MKSFVRKSMLTLLLIAPVALFCSCSCTKGLEQTIRDESIQAVAAIDEAILQINGQSAAWRDVMLGLSSELETISDDWAREVSTILERTTASIGQVALCVSDHAADRVVFELVRLKARILGEPEPVPFPMVCDTNPDWLEADVIARGDQDTVALFGYNLDGPFDVVLVDKAGEKTDIGYLLSKTSEYELVLRTTYGDKAVVTGEYDRVRLEWNGRSISEIPITIPTTPLCVKSKAYVESKIVDVPTELIGGDANWGGHGPGISINVLGFPFYHLGFAIGVWAKETGGDTTVSGSASVTLYTPPSGYGFQGPDVILDTSGGVLKLKDDKVRTANGKDDVLEIKGDADSIVASYEVMGLRNGDGVANSTWVRVYFRPFFAVISGPPPGSGTCIGLAP